jgi:hypothetical protein
MTSLSNLRFGKTLRIAVAAIALGTAGFAATSVSTAGDASAWEGPKNLSNGPGKGGGGGAWKNPKGKHGNHGHHGHGGWGPGFGYGYGAGLMIGAAMPIIVDAPDCYVVYQKKYIPGVGKVKQKVTVCD